MSVRLNAFGLSFIIFLLLVTSRVQNFNLRARENDPSNMQLSTWRRLWKLKTEKGKDRGVQNSISSAQFV